jgi:hypothetical protein
MLSSQILSILACSLLQLSAIVSAAPLPPVAMTMGEEVQKKRLPLPTNFDRETVQNLLNDIEKPQSASILKVGYFLRRDQSELPTSEGYSLLNDAINQTSVGSNRWFRLQNLKAFAAFRILGVSPSEGLTAYSAIFTQALAASKSKSDYQLRQSITEFVEAVPGKLKDLGLSKDKVTQDTLFKAWDAYGILISTSTKNQMSKYPEPKWKVAIDGSGAGELFIPYVEKTLSDTSVPKDFSLLFASATVLATTKPDMALELMKQAKTVLPQLDGKPERNVTARFYDEFVDLLVARGMEHDATSIQQERINILGTGQAKLLLLYKSAEDELKVQEILTLLSKPEAQEPEINEAASALFKLSYNSKSSDIRSEAQAKSLLNTYLSVNRARTMENELSARYTLGLICIRQVKIDEAKAILQIEKPKAMDSPRERSIWKAIQKLNESLVQSKPTARPF